MKPQAKRSKHEPGGDGMSDSYFVDYDHLGWSQQINQGIKPQPGGARRPSTDSGLFVSQSSHDSPDTDSNSPTGEINQDQHGGRGMNDEMGKNMGKRTEAEAKKDQRMNDNSRSIHLDGSIKPVRYPRFTNFTCPFSSLHQRLQISISL